MSRFPEENWKDLGEWVRSERMAAGYADTKNWSARVKRSSRVLLGLERGEPVGIKTLEAVADALGVPTRMLLHKLSPETINPVTPEQQAAEESLPPWERLRVIGYRAADEMLRATAQFIAGVPAEEGSRLMAESLRAAEGMRAEVDETARKVERSYRERQMARFTGMSAPTDTNSDLAAAAKEGVLEDPGENLP